MQEGDSERVRAGGKRVYWKNGARQRRQKCELIRQRQHIKQPGAAADRHLSVRKGSHAKPIRGSKFFVVGLPKNGSPRWGVASERFLRTESLPAVSVGTEVIS